MRTLRTPLAAAMLLIVTACTPAGRATEPTDATTASSTPAASTTRSDMAPETSTAAGGAPCELLSPEQIGSTVGQTMDVGTSAPGNNCVWLAASQEVSVTLGLAPTPESACVSGTEELEVAMALDDLGSPAFWLGEEDGMGILTWCGDGQMLTLAVVSFGSDAMAGMTFLEVSRQLIELAIAGL